MWFKTKDFAMSHTPKCGISSIGVSLGEHFDVVQSSEVIDVPVRVVWIRHPILRLQSAFSFFSMLHNSKINSVKHIPISACDSWESWVDYILINENEHWLGQVDSLSHDGDFLGTEVNRFEAINRLWSKYRKTYLRHDNRSETRPINDYRKSDIENYYSEDLKIWHLAEH